MLPTVTATGLQYLAANLTSLTTKQVLITQTTQMANITVATTESSNMTDTFDLPFSYPEMVLIAIVASFLSLLTVAGNCMVMISFKIDKQLQTISNYFLFSLAVADFAIGLISMPLYTVYIVAGRWPLGPHVCDTWLALDYLASNASVLNLLIISFDRYFSVTRPLTYRARRTPRRAGIMIAAAWLISLILWPPWIYAWPYIEGIRKVPLHECFIQFIETNNYITLGTALAAFYVPVTIMCVLYWRVWRETEKRQKDLSNLQAGKKNDSHRSNSSGGDQAHVTDAEHHPNDYRRSRTESSGAIDELKGTYSANASCLTGSHSRRQAGVWPNVVFHVRRCFRMSTWQVWFNSRRRNTDYNHEESYSDASNVATPASVDTPLASSISTGNWMNVIRDPYSTTPVRYKADSHRALVASKSLTTSIPVETGTQNQTPLLSGDDCDSRMANRSHSADSVFTILIRLPHDSATMETGEYPTIRMILADTQIRGERSRPNLASTSALRSKSVPVTNRSVPAPVKPNLTQSLSGSSRPSSSLLCGANLHLPDSLTKLTSLTKPNHLPLKGGKLKNNASPWVPRSCMPVAQSPLLMRSSSRFHIDQEETAVGGSAENVPENHQLPLDAKIIPKQLARAAAGHNSSPPVASSDCATPRRQHHHIYNAQHKTQAQQAAANTAALKLAKKTAKKPKKKNVEKKQERKAAKTLSAILLAFILTWTPYNVLILVKALNQCEDCIPKDLWDFAYYLCYINSTINPVCYALCNASFRHTYVRILTCKWHSRTKTAVQRGFYN